MDDNLIPLVGILCVFGLPVAGWNTVRVLQHRERMAMLERGIVPPERGVFRSGRRDWSPGPAFTTGGPMPSDGAADDPSCLLRKGIITGMIGLALLIGLSFIGYHAGDGPFQPASVHPGPWLLGGLIPLFVGLAQIMIAVLSGAQFGAARPMVPPGPPGPPFARYAPPPEPGAPGARYEELARPVPPPDRR